MVMTKEEYTIIKMILVNINQYLYYINQQFITIQYKVGIDMILKD